MTAPNGQRPGGPVGVARADTVEALTEAAFDRAPIPACLGDADGCCLRVNQALCRLLERTAAELEGRNCLTLLHPEDVGEERDRQEALFAGRVPGYEAAVRLSRPGGGTVSVHEHVSLVPGTGGAPGGAADWQHDCIMRQMVAVPEERTHQRAVEEGHTSIEFLARLSHELRTPLSSVVGFAEVLAECLSDPLQREAARHITAAGQHLSELVDDVFELSRADSGRLELRVTAVDVPGVLYEVAAMVLPAAQAAGVDVRVVPPPIRGCAVVADHRRLVEILLNLMTNAVKFSPRGSAVHCRVRTWAGQVTVSVSDEGPGLTVSEQLRLFMPFERLGAGARGIPGTGLGLAVSRRLAEAMAGTLTVDSVPGRGSTFSVSLPLAEPVTAPAAPVTPAAFAWSEKRHGILRRRPWSLLYVEEDEATVRLVDAVLSRYTNVILSVAATGSEALTRIALERPDVLLLDMRPSDICGGEVVARLRAAGGSANLPVVAISGHAPVETATATEAGARWFVPKPIRVGPLLDALAAALETRLAPWSGRLGP